MTGFQTFWTGAMANKFDVTQLRLQIENLLRDYPDLAEDEMLRADMLDGETNIYGVLMSLFQATDNNKFMLDAITGRVQQLAGRKARFARRIEFLRGLMLQVLQTADLKKVELPEATLSQRATQPQIVGEPDVEQLPNDLLKITIEPDRTKIRAALLDHRELPGLSLSNAAPTLAINVK